MSLSLECKHGIPLDWKCVYCSDAHALGEEIDPRRRSPTTKPHLKRINNLWCLWESTESCRNGECSVINKALTPKIAHAAYITLLDLERMIYRPHVLLDDGTVVRI